MSPRHILAHNLTQLMSASQRLQTIRDLHAAVPALSTGTIDRIRRAEVSTGVDALALLAEAFEVEPWQLLVPQSAAAAAPKQRLRSILLAQRATLEAKREAIERQHDLLLTKLKTLETPKTSMIDVQPAPDVPKVLNEERVLSAQKRRP